MNAPFMKGLCRMKKFKNKSSSKIFLFNLEFWEHFWKKNIWGGLQRNICYFTRCRRFDVEFLKQFQMQFLLSLNNLQIDYGDTSVNPSYRHKIYNLEIVCSITMLWLGKHIFPGILNTLEHPLVANMTSPVRTILLLPVS